MPKDGQFWVEYREGGKRRPWGFPNGRTDDGADKTICSGRFAPNKKITPTKI